MHFLFRKPETSVCQLFFCPPNLAVSRLFERPLCPIRALFGPGMSYGDLDILFPFYAV